MRIIKYICMKFIVSIDTITLVHVDMKKRNLHEGYCVYRLKDYYSTAPRTSKLGSQSLGERQS